MPRGGYQRPDNPAPVSGPGPQSQRTDGGPSQPTRYMSGGEYGEGQEMMNLQQSAPMAQAAQTPSGKAPSRTPTATLPPLNAPSDRPGEPVTQGAPVGPGAGPEILSGGMGSLGQATDSDVQGLKQYLPFLEERANMPSTPSSFVKFVKYLREA